MLTRQCCDSSRVSAHVTFLKIRSDTIRSGTGCFPPLRFLSLCSRLPLLPFLSVSPSFTYSLHATAHFLLWPPHSLFSHLLLRNKSPPRMGVVGAAGQQMKQTSFRSQKVSACEEGGRPYSGKKRALLRQKINESTKRYPSLVASIPFVAQSHIALFPPPLAAFFLLIISLSAFGRERERGEKNEIPSGRQPVTDNSDSHKRTRVSYYEFGVWLKLKLPSRQAVSRLHF